MRGEPPARQLAPGQAWRLVENSVGKGAPGPRRPAPGYCWSTASRLAHLAEPAKPFAISVRTSSAVSPFITGEPGMATQEVAGGREDGAGGVSLRRRTPEAQLVRASSAARTSRLEASFP